MRPVGSPQELERRRVRAVKLLGEGYQPVEVARMLGVDRRCVRRWRRAHREQGKAGLGARPAPGRPAALSGRDKKRLTRLLLKGAQTAGFATDLWSCPRVAELIDAEFGIRYHADHVGRILHSLGFSPQRPERRALERDEAEIRRWVTEQWPRIKKNRAPGSKPRVPR